MDILSDPDYLCALALTFRDINPKASWDSSSADQVFNDLRGGVVLDALARLIVFNPAQQVVALGAVLDSFDHIELYLSCNCEIPPRTTQHLKDVLERLMSVREAIEASPDRIAILEFIIKKPLSPKDTLYPPLASLSELQRVLLAYSIERIRARLLKSAWYDRFTHLVACINGVPAHTRTDLSEGEERALAKIQESPQVKRMFEAVDIVVSPVLKCLAEGSEVDLDGLRLACICMASMRDPLVDTMEYLNRFITGTHFAQLSPSSHLMPFSVSIRYPQYWEHSARDYRHSKVAEQSFLRHD